MRLGFPASKFSHNRRIACTPKEAVDAKSGKIMRLDIPASQLSESRFATRSSELENAAEKKEKNNEAGFFQPPNVRLRCWEVSTVTDLYENRNCTII